MSRFLVVTWSDIIEMIFELARRIYASGTRIDVVVAVLRGGYIVAKVLSDLLGIDRIATLEIKFYRGISDRAERPIVIQPMTMDIKDKVVLVVDDVADSGRTLEVAVNLVRLHGAKEVYTATLFVKPKSIVIPDYYVEQTDKWIVFPWEYGETLRQLIEKGYDIDSAVKELNLHKILNNKMLKTLITIAKSSVSSTGKR